MPHSIIPFLQDLDLEYKTFSHPPVLTCEEAERLCPPMPGMKNKNLFLRDKKKNSYLVCMAQNKEIPLKDLASIIGAKSLSFGSTDRLDEFLKVKPGSVGLLALINDIQAQIRVFIDQDLMDEEWFQSHPGVNDSTLCIGTADISKLLDKTGHSWQNVDLSQ
ncbi:MAG: prolyl-tRNA synthetase associated domain-containing protein [Candidatus Gracilibacteria bacterium]|nr:prolyl-tRNA synthetase associated domain-containing protein [Candidatus Gracilibacteria bacterium]